MPQAACCGRLGFETTLLLCSCGPHDELRLPDCNACLVFDGLSSKYLPSIEQTALPGCKMLQAAASSDPFDWVVWVCLGEIDIWVTSWCSEPHGFSLVTSRILYWDPRPNTPNICPHFIHFLWNKPPMFGA